jgi:Leucine-rich repeat (LRR) protein
LQFADNSFLGELIIFESISGLEDLRFLDCSENDLTGSLPDSLFNSQSLEKLYLSDNYFMGILPPLGGLSNARDIRLDGNQLTGNVPAIEDNDLQSLSTFSRFVTPMS